MQQEPTHSPAPLRLLIVGIKWPPETFIQRLIVGLHAEGFNVTVATPQRPSGPLSRYVRWVWAPSWHHSRWRRWLFFPWLILKGLFRFRRQGGVRIRQWLPRGNPDHWRHLYHLLPFWGRHFDGVYYPWLMSGYQYLYLLSQVPAATSLRGSHVNVAPLVPARQKQVTQAGRALQAVKAVHSVCHALKEQAIHFFKISPQKVSIIYTGVDTALFRPRSSPLPNKPSTFRIIWVGSLVWIKAVESALTAIAHLRDRGVPVHLTIVGDGPERQRMHYTIMDLGLEACVDYVGKKTPNELISRYQESDAFLLSSLGEGVANVAVEAMACGLPVVTTDVGGMREAVSDGVEGFVVPFHDAKAMADALEKLARDPALRRRMGQAARQRALAQFNLANQQKEYARFFREAFVQASS